MKLRPVRGFPLYRISQSGRLFSQKRKKFVKLKSGGFKPYPRYELWKNGVRHHRWAHRLVADAWVAPVYEKDVHHKDGDVLNYHARNLSVLTHTQHKLADIERRRREAKKKDTELKKDCPF